jgi:hypothetical protein
VSHPRPSSVPDGSLGEGRQQADTMAGFRSASSSLLLVSRPAIRVSPKEKADLICIFVADKKGHLLSRR